jgi:uncharacterized membrane protein YgcG
VEVEPVPAGEPFEARQRDEIDRAVRAASDRTGLRISVYVGRAEGDAETYAERLLAAVGGGDAVVVLVDPQARRLEIVSGTVAATRLDDGACGLAALSMSASFSGGDLVGGIVTGLRMLGDSVVI